MNAERCFSYLINDGLNICIGSEGVTCYPLTYTLEEGLEDWCDRSGHGFIKVIGCSNALDLSVVQSGKFLYKRARELRIVTERLYPAPAEIPFDGYDGWWV